MGFSILIMFGWHLWSIGQGETSVEVQDNDQYRKIARSRGQVRLSTISSENCVFSLTSRNLSIHTTWGNASLPESGNL